MLKYPPGDKDTESSNNPENLFVHRFHGNNEFAEAKETRLSTPSTFWKSPYTGDSGMSSSTRGVCMNPVISVTSPKKKQTTSINDTSKLTVKSILKHRTNLDYNTETSKKEFSNQASPEPQPNLITTGTGKGRPHGSPVRAKTAGKRVQFNEITKQITFGMNKDLINPFTKAPFTGRRLFLDRGTSTRILGTPKNSSPRWQILNRANTCGSNVTLSGGETNIKSQINAFIRKLRLTENEKNPTEEPCKNDVPDSQRKTAAKLKKSGSFSGTTFRPDWADFDIEKVHVSATRSSDNDSSQNQNEASPYIVYDAKSRSLSSGSMSIESFSSVSEVQVVERTPGGAKIFRPRPNASLYTKYKHITTNDNVNKYGHRPCSSVESVRQNSVNFCDSRKTSQILGWLEEVRSAQSTQLPPETPKDKT